MKLELADGQILEASGIDLVYSEIDKLDKKKDHLILSNGDDFIQIAFLGHNLYATEYKDRSGYYEARNQDLDLSLIKQIFEGFFNVRSEWKELTSWESLDNNTENSSSNYSSTSRSSGNFKDNLVDGLKRDAINWGKRKLRKFIKF